MKARPRLAVVILTKNEELNLPFALRSVVEWATIVIVVDSGSEDRTAHIARAAGCEVIVQPFEGYAKQRNAGLAAAATRADWVFFLDADEWAPPELRDEIDTVLRSEPAANGFFLRYRLIWDGRWIRRGYYGAWLLRLVRVGFARCEERSVNEHLIVDGATGRLNADFIHEDRKGITDWITKHVRYAESEAAAAFTDMTAQGQLDASLFGSQRERVRWIRTRVWNRLPPVFRPALYFFYRYVLRGGFLDGRPGFVFHFMQGFWYPLLIDLKYLEMRDARRAQRVPVSIHDRLPDEAGPPAGSVSPPPGR
jgi:glycosyltransferase involved in cell wall biosynthesis